MLLKVRYLTYIQWHYQFVVYTVVGEPIVINTGIKGGDMRIHIFFPWLGDDVYFGFYVLLLAYFFNQRKGTIYCGAPIL
jgi:hypothetical protein